MHLVLDVPEEDARMDEGEGRPGYRGSGGGARPGALLLRRTLGWTRVRDVPEYRGREGRGAPGCSSVVCPGALL